MKHSTKLMPVLGAVLLGGGLMTATAAIVAPQALAAEEATEIVEGSIQRVMADSNEFVLRIQEPEGQEAKMITIKVNEKTQYTLDGKESTMQEALVAGRHATVTHEEKTALKVDVKNEKRPS